MGRPLVRSHHWTEAELATLRRMASEDASWDDIGAALNRSPHGVQRKAGEVGLRTFPVKPVKRKLWTTEHTRKLMDMHRLGMGARSMSEALGFSRSHIENKIAELANGRNFNPPAATTADKPRKAYTKFVVALMHEANALTIGELKAVVKRTELDIGHDIEGRKLTSVYWGDRYSCVGSVAASCAEG
jgi:hypothetical protein